MAFQLYSTDDGHVPAWEYLPCKAITPKVGLCLAFDTVSEQLQVSDTPEYICMRAENAAVAAGTLIPVIRITKEMVFESALDAANANLKAGSLVDVDATGLLVDADSSADKVFQITALNGTAAGSSVRGRFVK
ncbi:MAG TPA: hypothetical protein PKD52_01075 [Clostridiales bacterium]|nr:hypothetical protein [Clostridiales bacterium]